MVIFGMSPVLARMNAKSGTLIGWVQRTRLLISATGCAARLPGRAAPRVLAADGVDADLAELAVEEAVIGAAAEFAVGRELQARRAPAARARP